MREEKNIRIGRKREEREEEQRTIRLPSSTSTLLPMTMKGKFSGSRGEACKREKRVRKVVV